MNAASYSPAGQLLFGNGSLPQELKDETDEQRRLRLQQQQQQRALGPAAQLLGLGAR
jgi:hypothetical protein